MKSEGFTRDRQIRSEGDLKYWKNLSELLLRRELRAYSNGIWEVVVAVGPPLFADLA
jgi:hypothetical protein